jgi:hypothetical protein
MTAEEIRRQRIIAKATLERECHLQAISEVKSTEVLEKQEIIVNQFLKINEKDFKNNSQRIREDLPKSKVEKENEVDPILAEIRAELSAIDLEKNKQINLLASMPTSSNQKELVAKIKSLREEYVNKNDEVYYFLTHGERYRVTNEETEESGDTLNSIMERLPKDKFMLNKKLNNRRSDLSKYKARLKEAKSEVKKVHQQKNISQAELEINAMEQLMSSL